MSNQSSQFGKWETEIGLLMKGPLPALTLADVSSTAWRWDIRVVNLPFSSMLHRGDRRISEAILKARGANLVLSTHSGYWEV